MQQRAEDDTMNNNIETKYKRKCGSIFKLHFPIKTCLIQINRHKVKLNVSNFYSVLVKVSICLKTIRYFFETYRKEINYKKQSAKREMRVRRKKLGQCVNYSGH